MMNEFELDEIGLIHTMVGMACDGVPDDAPQRIKSVMQSALAKLEKAIDQRCQEFNEFQEITSELDDLLIASQIIQQNPDAVTTDYN
jgi:hypothetical protein